MNTEKTPYNYNYTKPQPVKTLRDEIAMACVGSSPHNKYDLEKTASFAYKLADAMLKAREK